MGVTVFSTVFFRPRAGGSKTDRLTTNSPAARRSCGRLGIDDVSMSRFDGGWAAYFCTDAQVDVRDILETVAARWAIEEPANTLMRHDVKEIWGAGQQQVRNIWSNIGCWHLNQWMYTLVESCSGDVAKPKLTDRSLRPWDNPDRRPSHADRRSTIAREMLKKNSGDSARNPKPAEIQVADQ